MKNWAFYAIIVVGFGIYKAVTDADRDASGSIVDAGSIDVFDIKVGDCFDDSDSWSEVSTLPAVPCSEPHDNEAYAVFRVDLPSYPGEEEMWEYAHAACLERFEGFVGLEYDESILDIYTLYPSTEGWQQNDREVICALYDMNYDKLTGSVEGRGI